LRRKVGGCGALGSEFLELWSLSDDADELVGEVEPPILALGELSGDRGSDDKLGYVCDMYAEKFSEGAPGVVDCEELMAARALCAVELCQTCT
jgi:hypothetical protein